MYYFVSSGRFMGKTSVVSHLSITMSINLSINTPVIDSTKRLSVARM